MTVQDVNTLVNSASDFSLFRLDGTRTSAQIKKIRRKYGMRQTDFMDLLGVVHITYSSWEIRMRKSSSLSCSLLQIAEKYPALYLTPPRRYYKGNYTIF